MPKFHRQNKKRIDPRYFLDETTNRDESEEEILSESDDDCWCEDSDGNKTRDFVSKGTAGGESRGCRGSETKVCPDKLLEPEVKSIKNRYKKIDQMFDKSGVFTNQRGLKRGKK